MADLLQLVTVGLPPKRQVSLWTVPRVQELIRQQFGLLLDPQAVDRLLRQLALVPRYPLEQALRKDPALVTAWTAQHFPAIRAMAERTGGDVWFVDETLIFPDAVPGGTATAPPPSAGAAAVVTAIRAVSTAGAARFMVVDSAVDAAAFSFFAARLVAEAVGPVFLVTTPSAVHRSRALRALADTSGGGLRLFYLPR